MSAQVTLRGRLTKDPDLSYTPQGKPLARFTVVTDRRVKDDQSGEWASRDTTFWSVVTFGQLAEGCAESLVKGSAVVVYGNAFMEEWETREGEKRRTLKVTADDVAPSIRWDRAEVKRTDRARPASSEPVEDPWATASTAPPF